MSGLDRLRHPRAPISTDAHPRPAPQVPEVYMPASWPSGLGDWISAKARAWRRRRRFRSLLDLDDRMLDDIGLTRGEIEEALRLPLEADASRIARASVRARRIHPL